ncbi:urocanate hydratase-like [Ischnura elegans]|uniref:urocanate hydratase-like n=1 Tax=Ischnura elegans TaxID=197161 RepID=UPI001ED875AD|nr:urocanate hydratase-like [Ischnura elegans]
MTIADALRDLCSGLPVDPLPPPKQRDPSLPHAPVRAHRLGPSGKKQALKNALRYFPPETHHILAPEFAEELKLYGHIYMYRFMPDIPMKAYPISEYPANCIECAAAMLMLMNNLDVKVAQFPQELVTYGGNGQCLSNWAQFRLVLHYLSIMKSNQTLHMYSGHPLGLFPSPPLSPKVVITNGMVIPNYSSRDQYDDMFALGVTMYGQMTAGSYCYIGPQGIVHGTTITVLNAGRKYLGVNDLGGKIFITSGLGGMSGAQAKAAVIAGCVGIIAEVSYKALKKRHEQGWLGEIEDDLDRLINRIRIAKKNKEAVSIGYHGNVVALWERLADELERTGERLVDLGSDQTSCHDPFGGGYYPVQISFEEALKVLGDPSQANYFKKLVRESLCRQVAAINKLTEAGAYFWDYGNAFLLEARRAGADVNKKINAVNNQEEEADVLSFRYPSYVQDIMGDIFSLGFGPFRWVCTSGLPEDLNITDKIAAYVIERISKGAVSQAAFAQYSDNLRWIKNAGKHQLVVGSQARILYSDWRGRIEIALEFNDAVSKGEIKGPVVISRDHHDVSGTDSPFRETSDVKDGSAFTADMAVQNCIGDSFRGASWVALHNGGGVGWGEVINGGFGLLLDGSNEAANRARFLLSWDVGNGLTRRCWAGNQNALSATTEAMLHDPNIQVTLPNKLVNEKILDGLFS